MSNATAEAPARANKAPPRARATPSPAATPAIPEDQGATPTADEQLVAATLREQVVAIYETRWNDLRGESIEVLHAAAEALEKLPHGAYVGLYRAASLVAGALAVERESTPPGAAIPQLESVYQSLDTESLGYNVEMEPYEAMAAGIRAAQRQFCDHPMPTIHSLGSAQHKSYNHQQLRSILTAIAGVAVTLDQVLVSAQDPDEGQNTSILIDTARVLACHLGSMADSAVGGSVLGEHDRWNYGPNFAQEGKAGAA